MFLQFEEIFETLKQNLFDSEFNSPYYHWEEELYNLKPDSASNYSLTYSDGDTKSKKVFLNNNSGNDKFILHFNFHKYENRHFDDDPGQIIDKHLLDSVTLTGCCKCVKSLIKQIKSDEKYYVINSDSFFLKRDSFSFGGGNNYSTSLKFDTDINSTNCSLTMTYIAIKNREYRKLKKGQQLNTLLPLI